MDNEGIPSKDKPLTGFSAPEIEQATVSALLQWPLQCFPKAEASKIGPEHFSAGPNRILYDCARNQWQAGNELELVSFTALLRDNKFLDGIGGAWYVTSTWCNTCYTPKIFDYYLEILLDNYAKRVLRRTCVDKEKEATAPGGSGFDLIDEAVEQLGKVPRVPAKADSKHETLMKLMAQLEGRAQDEALPTQIQGLDQDSRICPRDLILITGTRKVGKSVLALSIVGNLLKSRPGIPILYFSLEDDAGEVFNRLAAGLARVPMKPTPQLSIEDIEKLADAFAFLDATKLNVRHDCFDLARILAVAEEEKNRNNTQLIVVDYAQLVHDPASRRDGTREQEVASVSRGIRTLAMKLGVPIILLSQLNQEGATRESRALEHDATACWELSEAGEDEPGVRWLKIPFQRNGTSGVRFKVTFLGAIARIENHHKDQPC